MNSGARIVKAPEVLHGKPRVEGTRIGVLLVGDLVRNCGWTSAEVIEQFDVTDEQVTAAFRT